MEKLKKRNTLRQSFMGYVTVTFVIVIALSAAVLWSCFAVRGWLLPASDEVYLNIEQTDSNGNTTTMSTRMKIGENAQKALSSYYAAEDGKIIEPTGDVKYSITSVENSYTMLSPKRQMLYHFCGAAMIALPLIFSLSGILLCGLQFYKRKLKTPIDILLAATEKIAGQDLDFEVTRPCDDELGELCTSFEQMRGALAESNKKMWGMLEERKQLQLSLIHI